MYRVFLMIGILLPLLTTACSPGRQERENKKLEVFVSIPPQAYFAERLGGDRINVQALVAPGQSPATYQLSPRQLRNLARADVFFSIGVPFENALLPKIKVSMPDLRIVDTRQGITLRELESPLNEAAQTAEKETEHEQQQGEQQQVEDEHGHQHTGLDPHIWMSPLLVKRQAQTMRDELSELDPAGKSVFAANYQALVADLDRVHERIEDLLKPFRGKAILVFHPSYGYFTDAYGLKQLVVEAEGKAPGARQLSRLIAEVKKSKLKVVFIQLQFDQASARAIATAIEGRVVTLDPLAKDYLANLERIAQKIREALDQKTP